MNCYDLLLCNGSTCSWLWRLGLYLRPVYKDFNHRYPKLASENRWRLYITKNGSSIEDSGYVTPCPGAPPQAASLCSAARAGRLRDRVQTEPLSSILPSWTGIVDSSPKIKTNSDPSVNRSKREPYKRSAGRYCFGNHSEAPVTETLLRRNPARLKGVLKKSKQTATRVSQNFYFELLLTKSLLGLSPAGCGVKWHICAHRSGFTPASELLDSSLAKAATANRFFAGNQHHFILINMGSQTCEINVGMKGFFPLFIQSDYYTKVVHICAKKLWKSLWVDLYVIGKTPGASLICRFEQCSVSEHNSVKNFPGDIWLRIVVVRPIVCKILNVFPVWVQS